eukprot:TRINITY_DN22980_c0_g1_i1.p1 TRINITY_DN22980_c0_g1~~TRINITY_DN22980_c0_g1_i1.p1  ORF type:complete len:473 (+),score=86.75 TRINITY_DN22980_c0_g1_i1:60-1478(+)
MAIFRALLPFLLDGLWQPFVASQWPPQFDRKTAYVNLSAVLDAGGCGRGAHTLGRELSAEEKREGAMACKLKCQAHEAPLERGFEHWWDHALPQAAMLESCDKGFDRFSGTFIAAITRGQVMYRCCTRGDNCDPSEVNVLGNEERGRTSDLELLMMMLQEVVTEFQIADTYVTFNTGDQPYTDKSYWAPVPQFHWVSSPGHWTIPFPNPFQLIAHASGMLGDSVDVEKAHVSWDLKIPKIFFRGSLSSPDNAISKDFTTLPRVRLVQLALQHPHLFDIALTEMDGEMHRIFDAATVAKVQKLVEPSKRVKCSVELPKYKYVLNVHAVLSSWRLSELLASGSLLLLQEDSTAELMHEWLEPWTHYVPVSVGLSDLVEKVQWLEAHQLEARQIAERGFQRFKERMRSQDTYCYLWQALRSLVRASERTELPSPESLAAKGWSRLRSREPPRWWSRHRRLRDLLREGTSSNAEEL